MDTSWIIPLLLLIPTVTALVMLLPFKQFDDRRFACRFAVGSGVLTFLVSLVGLGVFFSSSAASMKLTGSISWVSAFGLNFDYGVDAISLWLVVLSTFMMPLAMLNSYTVRCDEDAAGLSATSRIREYFFWMLILEALLLGVFVAQDIIGFYLCYELTLVPFFFLVAIFGRKKRVQAAKVFFLYAFAGSMLTLASILYIVWFAHQPQVLGQWTFNIEQLYGAAQQMSATQQAWVMLGLIIGFTVKTPMFPLHTWMPFVHTQTPRNGAVDVSGVLLKIGFYGFIRLVIPMTPKAVVAFAPYIGAFAIISILYCAIISWVQTDYKRLVAYSSVSHMGFCVMGLFALDATGIGATGSIMHLINQGLATGAMFLCIGMIYERFKTRKMDDLSGLGKVMPIWSGFMVFFVFASIGLPGLNGFVGEFLTMLGTFISPVTLGISYAVPAALAMILAAMYMLYMTGKIVFGPVKVPVVAEDKNPDSATKLPKDLTRREVAILLPIAAVCLWMGLAPFSVLESLNTPMRALIKPAQQVAQKQYSVQKQTVAINKNRFDNSLTKNTTADNSAVKIQLVNANMSGIYSKQAIFAKTTGNNN